MEEVPPNLVVSTKENPRYFYRIVNKDDPKREFNRLFAEYNDAIVHAMLTAPRLLPVPAANLHLADFKKTAGAPESNLFRFPNSEGYRLVRYVLRGNINYYHRTRTPQEIQADTDDGRVVASLDIHRVKTALLSANYPFDLEQDHNWNAIFQTVRNAASLGTAGQPEYQINGVYITNRHLMIEPTDIYSIDWNHAWMLFCRKVIQEPSLQVVLRSYFEIISDDRTRSFLISARTVPGYDDCWPGMFGYQNPGTSCFMDSTLMCMFAFKNSPFPDNLIGRGLVPGPGYPTCSQDPAQEAALRQKVYNRTKLDYQSVINGYKTLCSGLRMTLGRDCNITGNPEDDFSERMADPNEMYQRLLHVLNYQPMEYTEETWRAENRDGLNEVAAQRTVHPSSGLPSLHAGNEDLRVISWPNSWNTAYENVDSKDQLTFRRIQYAITRADVIVVHLDRSPEGRREVPVAKAEIPSLPLLVPPTEFNFSSMLNLQTSVQPSLNPFASLVGGTPVFPVVAEPPAWINERRIEIEHYFRVNGNVYELRAAVYSPSDAHYGALLKCGDSWFDYDDLNVTNPVMDKRIATELALKLLETRANLFFYYPPFPLINKTEEAEIARLTQLLNAVRVGSPRRP